jgi:hypothetical protein
MLSKLLFTLLIAAAGVAYARWRSQAAPRRPERRPPRGGGSAAPWLPRAVGLGFAALLLAGVGTYYYLEWRADHQVITIRVTDTRNGTTATYRALRGDIRGRRFTTLEGWEVRVSDSERVEMMAAE